ncbi:helix-turn-helix domain-containing protein [Streptomyces sp. NPDC102274]|uniref:helix-turn-helix domain-containing protein n=1 Tax=Streptomyces sp. NPDC102274 TaxID=3366151 RepID=UPI00381F628C
MPSRRRTVYCVSKKLGSTLRRLRKLSDLTQEQLSERSAVSVDVIRHLEQGRKKSALLPTLHALADALGVELTTLLGDPPGAPSTGEGDSPALVAVRRAITPPLFSALPDPSEAEGLSVSVLRDQIADAWSDYHAAEFDSLMKSFPGIVMDARRLVAADLAGAQAALGKVLQLGGHLAVRLGKTDLALMSLERAIAAADASSDPLLTPMICNSVAWAYQRQNRLDDATAVALHAAARVERDHLGTAEGVRVWGGLLMSAATSFARRGDYDRADEMMRTAEKAAERVAKLPAEEDTRMVSVFSKSSVRIERVRLAVQFGHPEEALRLSKGMRLAKDTPPSWRTWLLLDVARAHTDVGDAEGAVRTLKALRRVTPTWMQHHTLAVAIVEDLWALPNHPEGLRSLAEFLGVAD